MSDKDKPTTRFLSQNEQAERLMRAIETPEALENWLERAARKAARRCAQGANQTLHHAFELEASLDETDDR